jgi:hypothetical protein
MTGDDATDLELLLTDATDRVPVLEGGLPESALDRAPQPRGRDAPDLAAPDRDPNDLPLQRWAVIAARGEAGDRALAAIRPLIDHRHAQQGDPPTIYRVDPDLDDMAALRWRDGVWRAESVPEDIRPRYLLILGDLDQVSLELQHALASCAFVGRLHCPTPAGYRDYAEKVVASETARPAERPHALFYTVQDGTAATGVGYADLVEPCIAMTSEWAAAGKLALASVDEVPYSDWSPSAMLTQVGAATPAAMLSLSHGLGAPRSGWRSAAQQRALQGALSMGLEEPLAADAVREAAFLPGGVWLCVACFAAGTPRTSAFHSWISALAGGDDPRVREVLRSLPASGEPPFLAALPQTLLANPRGPLAVVGHVDLAWSYGFLDPHTLRSRASRMFSALRSVLAGSRVGVGLDALMSAYRENNDDLTARYQLQRDAQVRGEPDPVDPRRLGRLWMQRNDLRGYILLGDPAARLAIDPPAPARPARPPDTKEHVRETRPADTFEHVPTVRPTEPAQHVQTARQPEPPVLPAPQPEPPPVRQTRPPDPPDPVLKARQPDPPEPVRQTRPPDPPAPAAPSRASPGAVLRERAVLALLRGDEAPRSLAARLGVSLDDLFDWLELYRDAGRRALG